MGDILKLGELEVKILHTPGHTPGSICLLVDDVLLTGDTLFVGYCGRTDGVGGSSKKLYFSLFRYNPYYQCRSLQEFVELRKRGVD